MRVITAYHAPCTMHMVKVINDMIFSIPGGLLPCYFYTLLGASGSAGASSDSPAPVPVPVPNTRTWWDQNDNQLEWPALHESLVAVYGRGMSNRRELLYALGVPQIYRGPYGVSHHDAGKFACRLLRELWDGPSCGPVWQAKFICRAAREYGTKPGGVTDDDVRAILTRFWERVGDDDKKRAENGLHQVTSYSVYSSVCLYTPAPLPGPFVTLALTATSPSPTHTSVFKDLLADHKLVPRADESIEKEEFMKAAFCERIASDPS